VRPTREQIEPAALDLIERYGAMIMGTARRYSLSPEDAEDAYQRGLEILLTKAPSTDEQDLVPWLKTVVKHEAFTVRRSRERAGLPAEESLDDPAGRYASPAPHEQAERYERLRLGAEAIRRLKPQEIRCLLLRAEGYSYRQICEETGWTYTKVNRCLTEGRRNFLDRVAGIEGGAECDRLAPMLSALADGEATRQEMLALRPHLRSCLVCRATLREYRSVPASVTALAVPVSTMEPDLPGFLARAVDSVTSWYQERSLLLGMKVQQAVEMASAGKVAAVAASTVAIGGGGLATVNSLEVDSPEPRRTQREARKEATPPPAPPPPVVAPVRREKPREAQPEPEGDAQVEPEAVVAAPAPATQAPAPTRKQSNPGSTPSSSTSDPPSGTQDSESGGTAEPREESSTPQERAARTGENGGYGL